MSDYTKVYDGAAKDAAQSVLAGSDFDTEFTLISVAVATKANKAIPATTGNLAGLDATGDLQDTLLEVTGNQITADLLGNVTGNVTGNLTGNVIGNVTGDLTGDVIGGLTGNVIGNVTGALTGNADTATTAASTDKVGVLNVLVLDIGDWNMDTTNTITKAHGLTLTKIRSVSVLIRNDADGTYTDLNKRNGTENGLAGVSVDGANVNMSRTVGGEFDNTNHDSIAYNRGYITIWYID